MPLTIRLLEPDSQRRGDLFGRLITDYFHALGYGDFTLNVHKAGREIDLGARHRTENRHVLAECKATVEKVGGDALNKFAGALAVEQGKPGGPTISGYFISLSGFRSSALEQERELSQPRLTLVTGEQVVAELIAGHIVVAPTTASAAAGNCLDRDRDLRLDEHLELLGDDSGWYWQVRFTESGSPRAFALVHADGTPLGRAAAQPLIDADRRLGGDLHELELLDATGAGEADEAQIAEARAAYQAFLAHDHGHITVDGLPAEENLGSRSIALQDLFVPMHLQPLDASADSVNRVPLPSRSDASTVEFDDVSLSGDLEEERLSAPLRRQSLGEVLASSGRIAVLGPPGSGKSTLLGRLAVGYGVPGRRTEIDDGLPDRDWLPLVIRCRQLDELATRPVLEILKAIPLKAEMPQHAAVFDLITAAALRDGTALVLVDGLDEITDPRMRMTFAKQLRTFIGTYPSVQVVLTSREAGFRLITGALSDVSTSYRVAEFDDADIRRLTVAWNVLVIGDSTATRKDAAELANTIVETDRVRRLARNPLLLTTLLLVRRWVGELPRKRTILYDKAIEVLLMTWNVEAHEPIDLEEAIPQLAYVAFCMTRDQTQTLSGAQLVHLLERARAEMPEVLGHTRVSPTQFLERVEERSSLLSLSGHGVENGVLSPLYEFKHLTFQEYLSALALVRDYYPGSRPGRSSISVIRSKLTESQWLEIIPMVTVLAGRRAAPIIKMLVKTVQADADRESFDPDRVAALAALVLAQCLADEVQAPPAMIEQAASALSLIADDISLDALSGVLTSRHGEVVRQALTGRYFLEEDDQDEYASMMSDAYLDSYLRLGNGGSLKDDWLEVIERFLGPAQSAESWAAGCLMAMSLLFETALPMEDRANGVTVETAALYRLERILRPALEAEHPGVRYAAAWAFAWLGRRALDARRFVPKVLPVLYRQWKDANDERTEAMLAWAFSEQPLLPQADEPLGRASKADTDFLKREITIPADYRDDRQPAALIASYYFGGPWTTSQIVARAEKLTDNSSAKRRLLRRLR